MPSSDARRGSHPMIESRQFVSLRCLDSIDDRKSGEPTARFRRYPFGNPTPRCGRSRTRDHAQSAQLIRETSDVPATSCLRRAHGALDPSSQPRRVRRRTASRPRRWWWWRIDLPACPDRITPGRPCQAGRDALPGKASRLTRTAGCRDRPPAWTAARTSVRCYERARSAFARRARKSTGLPVRSRIGSCCVTRWYRSAITSQ